jgi:hypothetical protein
VVTEVSEETAAIIFRVAVIDVSVEPAASLFGVPEDGGSRNLRNVENHLPDSTVSPSRLV